MFIPVLDQPLSSNRYYAINGRGFNSREAYVSGKKEEEERVSCCFGLSYVPEPRPKQLDPHDIYQQFEIHQKKPSSHCYYATSVAPDGVSTWLLRKDNWVIEYSRSKEFELIDDAKGLNKELRSELPSLGTSVVVGKWYVPFVFVKERKVKDQHKRSMYYIMTLEQRWEEVFSCENDKGENRDVVVHVEVENEIVKLEGQKIVRGVDANRFVWFGVGDKKIGLGSVVERMKWEEERFGWTSKGDRTINPSELTLFPTEGPNSGVLVIQDEESQPICCFGKCFDCDLNGLPFPQNTKLTVKYQIGSGDDRIVLLDSVAFVPVLNQPPSSNLYYVIRRRGKHTGEACVSAKEGDRVPCCFCFSYVSNVTPRPLDPFDIYQQFEIHQRGSSTHKFFATSVASDGIPPRFLRRKGWTVPFSASEDFGLIDDAKGIVNAKLRYELPDFDKSVVVGKWYVPFLFVKEGDAKDQMKNSMYYSMTLQQIFEEVFFCENVGNKQFEVEVDVEVETEVVKLDGEKIAREAKGVDSDGIVWFIVSGTEKIGLGSVVLERMKWEEERFGWSIKGDQMRSNIKKSEKFEGGSSFWKSYRCYVLVESFELKRMDESLVLKYEFRHVDKLKSKWD
ncbi:hypothetical protein AALP_AA1G148500 [Arabis alpina]|uniref:Insecticidal crystal toxin domain-containing protein n=1 Tax=Arabis alpina TaxID=50452 RepID=A0A087HNA6_ARAAL|nr:hypothetical protein AALP_AA1G148500 [Arabis alpina]